MALRRRDFNLMAAGTFVLPSLAQAQSNSLDALYEAARKEGELTWYTVPQTSEVAERMGRLFTARYPGVKVNVVRTTAQVAFQRLNQDLRAGTPNCDVFSSTDFAHFIDLKARNLLMKNVPAAVATQDKRVQHLDPDGYFHSSGCFMMGMVYNTQKVAAADVPKNWSDLLNPKWAGKSLVAHPAYSGAAGAWCIEMQKLYGDSFFSKLAANRARVGRSTIDGVTNVISGEALISAAPMSLAVRSAQRGNPVATLAPKEGPVLILSCSGVLAHTRRPNASKLFMEWLLGSDDTLQVARDEFSVPLRANAQPAPGVLGLADADPLLAPTPPQMVAQIPKVIELWKDAFGV